MFIFYVYSKTLVKKYGVASMFDYNEKYNKMDGSYRNKWDGKCYRFLRVK